VHDTQTLPLGAGISRNAENVLAGKLHANLSLNHTPLVLREDRICGRVSNNDEMNLSKRERSQKISVLAREIANLLSSSCGEYAKHPEISDLHFTESYDQFEVTFFLIIGAKYLSQQTRFKKKVDKILSLIANF